MGSREVCGFIGILLVSFLPRSAEFCSTVSAGNVQNTIIIGNSKVLNVRVHVFEMAEMLSTLGMKTCFAVHVVLFCCTCIHHQIWMFLAILRI